MDKNNNLLDIEYNDTNGYSRSLIWVFFIAAIVLRLILFWINLTGNAFDDHYGPIIWIINHGTIAPKDALWQSYQPPVFYVISAMVGKLAISMELSRPVILKIFQFINCFYGISTIGVIYLILKKINLSNFSRAIAFGLVCFLPRHIYMSAMHSNDAISVLFIAISIYLMLLVLERKFAYPIVICLCICITISIFTKYTAFVVLPMVCTIFVPVLFGQIAIPKKKIIISCLLLILVPLLFLSAYCYRNIKNYQTPLPWNDTLSAPVTYQPRAEIGMSFVNFKPLDCIKSPILAPGNIDSFWTLVYSRMWFDVEPKFLYYIDVDWPWWNDDYYGWIRGEKEYPDPIIVSRNSLLMGSTLITIGLVPLLFIIIGGCRSIFDTFGLLKTKKSEEAIKYLLFLVLFFFNAVGVIMLALKSPVFSSAKATYFMGSIPAFSAFIGLGIMTCDKNKLARWILSFLFGGLFILVTLHIVHIAYSADFKMGI